MKKKKIIALDFDGVIIDSIWECLICGFNSYKHFNKKTKLFGGKKVTFENFNKIKKKFKKEIKEYERLRTYVRDVLDFYVIFYIIDGKLKVKNQKEFDNARRRFAVGYYKYQKEFYKIRKRIHRLSKEKWLKLTPVYPGIKKILSRLQKDFIVILSTNTDVHSVLEKTKPAGIKIKKEQIFNKDISTDKKVQLKTAAKVFKARLNTILFIEDQVSNLIDAKRIGVRGFLATWGYNNRGQCAAAKKHGFKLLTLKNFENEMMKLR